MMVSAGDRLDLMRRANIVTDGKMQVTSIKYYKIYYR